MNIKKSFFLFLLIGAFAMPVFAADTDSRPVVPGVDPKPVADVPFDTSTDDARTIPSISFVAGAYKELYENKVGDVVKEKGTQPYNVDNGNVITSIDVQEIPSSDNLKTRRIKYSRDNIKIPVQTVTNGQKRTYNSTTYLNVWVD